jgi:NAD(P)-dependent dehydrogenase (short-subunit alcohol dehydrogenase family)
MFRRFGSDANIVQRGPRLLGLVAIVTGASRGNGAAIARRFAADGIAVLAVVHSLRPDEDTHAGSLEETVGAIRERGGSAAGLGIDLADLALDRSAIVRYAEAELGAPVDILVNNAVSRLERTYERMTGEHFRRTLEVNGWAGWDIAIHALQGMRRQGSGWILNIASGGAGPRVGPPYRPMPRMPVRRSPRRLRHPHREGPATHQYHRPGAPRERGPTACRPLADRAGNARQAPAHLVAQF